MAAFTPCFFHNVVSTAQRVRRVQGIGEPISMSRGVAPSSRFAIGALLGLESWFVLAIE
jgi:hypothetical protein